LSVGDGFLFAALAGVLFGCFFLLRFEGLDGHIELWEEKSDRTRWSCEPRASRSSAHAGSSVHAWKGGSGEVVVSVRSPCLFFCGFLLLHLVSVNTILDTLACEGGQLAIGVSLDQQGDTTKGPNNPVQALGRVEEISPRHPYLFILFFLEWC
jgi:hypothetical protein